VTLQESVPSNMALAMTYCHAFPIVTPFMKALYGIGISSVDYDQDAYIRSIQALYRGYNNHFYTYLGLSPALVQRQVNQIRYTSDALYLDEQPIPLLDNQKILINWRNPRYLLDTILKKHPIAAEAQLDLQNTLNATTPETSNVLLGGGHIYREISILDILRRSHINAKDVQGTNPALSLPLTQDEQARFFNIPYYPTSGAFSFKNKIVIIGNTVTDIHRTPLSNTLSGPEVVASGLDMMLHDRQFIHSPTPWLNWLLVGSLVLLIIGTILTFENLFVGFAMGCLFIVLYWLMNVFLFIYGSLWLDLILPTFTLSMTLVGSTLYRYYVHDQEKNHLTNVFSKYVSPQIMHEIMKNPGQALDNLRGGKKVLTVLFVDLEDFTKQFENADPEIMVSQLNEYFDVMTDVLLSYGGTYDKYMGDSIMAFFGAPAELPRHAEMACRAALALQHELENLNNRWTAEGKFLLRHGIGISSGEMFVGNFGSRNIKNFTVMGSNVNLGSRLEAYTRIAHWPIIISEHTLSLIQNIATVRDLGKITIKGFSHQIQIYGLETLLENPDFL
jgi:class 3 adenylate cyclase